jgi:class 3 adenylate cyclase
VLTVLFADLVGFTARSEAMDPEDVAAELNRYQSGLRVELERYGGTVEKFIGDAVMALFGAPLAHEDDPERAVRAALAIRDWSHSQGVEVRIGVNTGEALVTVGARPEAGETMAAGDVVNTAARLQTAAPVNGVLVGESTFRATQRRIDYREHEPVEAKGKAQPVVVYEALSARSRASVDRVHGTSLVGRRGEVELLEHAVARALDERSCQLVTLIGVPGIGKSRLAFELGEAVDRRPELIAWRQGRCLPYGDGVTYWALGEIVKAEAGILEGDSTAETERKLAALAHDPWVESHLRPLVGMAGTTDGGGSAREEAFTAWRQFFEGVAEERPLVVVLEDLHWADDHLLDFIDHLVDWAAGVPLLVIATARPEFLSRRPAWGGGKPNALTISLSALSDDDTARLLGQLLAESLPADTQAELLARAGGNPLYAEEFALMLRDRADGGALPETVQGLIAARLDLLEPEQKVLVQDAAVIGKQFWLGALGALSGLGPPALEAALHSLERKEFVGRERASAIAGDREYMFRHVLVRDVAYGQIPRQERAEKHLQTARWLEQLGRRSDHAEMLAHHYLEALTLTRAAGGATNTFSVAARAALSDAGDRAFALNAYDVSERFYRAALELAAEEEPAVRGRLLLRLGRTLYLSGARDEETLRDAHDELLAAGDIEGAAEAAATLCEQRWMAGERGRAIEQLAVARELTEALPACRTKANVLSLGSRLMMVASENERAIQLGEEALALAEQFGLEDIRAATLNSIGCARTALGDAERGREQLKEAIDHARRANVPWEVSRAINNLAAITVWTPGANLPEATELAREARAHAERYGQGLHARFQDGILVLRTYDVGLWDESSDRADAFLSAVAAGAPHYLAAQCHSVRAAMRLGRGDLDAALADVDRTLDDAERANDPQVVLTSGALAAHVLLEAGHEQRAARLADELLTEMEAGRWVDFGTSASHVAAWTLTSLGRGERFAVALESQRALPFVRAGIAFATGDAVQAAEICAATGATTEEAYARLCAAELLGAQARRAEADAQLQRALAFYRSVGATYYVQRAESLLAEFK